MPSPPAQPKLTTTVSPPPSSSDSPISSKSRSSSTQLCVCIYHKNEPPAHALPAPVRMLLSISLTPTNHSPLHSYSLIRLLPGPGPPHTKTDERDKAELAPKNRRVIQDARRLAWDALDAEARALRVKAAAADAQKRAWFVGVCGGGGGGGVRTRVGVDLGGVGVRVGTGVGAKGMGRGTGDRDREEGGGSGRVCARMMSRN
ncbi:hypothetical protein DXG01_009590 [Tephrocybe rancida]|nr:hypothetical protein DXG01_009590 [Tephrocybe rancida]